MVDIRDIDPLFRACGVVPIGIEGRCRQCVVCRTPLRVSITIIGQGARDFSRSFPKQGRIRDINEHCVLSLSPEPTSWSLGLATRAMLISPSLCPFGDSFHHPNRNLESSLHYRGSVLPCCRRFFSTPLLSSKCSGTSCWEVESGRQETSNPATMVSGVPTPTQDTLHDHPKFRFTLE